MNNYLFNWNFEYIYIIKNNNLIVGMAKIIGKHNRISLETKIGNINSIKEIIYEGDELCINTWLQIGVTKRKLDIIQMSKGYAKNSKGTKIFYNGQCYIMDIIEFIRPDIFSKFNNRREIVIKVLLLEEMKIKTIHFKQSLSDPNLILMPNGKILYDKDGMVINYSNSFSKMSISRTKERINYEEQ